MTTNKTTTKKNDQAQPSANGPDFVAYTVIERGRGRKAFWRPIGSAWKHEDGNGLQVLLDAFPIDGRLTLRVPMPRDEEAAA